ncbi:TetR/AcrR family transcriptional regulator [Desertihabitans aurantiacus]|uniref:TetR/AcrR family transcriptional regulator n=1 Tax=Desertihabitans aurantiacus TaxID=2282477 RepID=UPI00130083FD|nr:TetR/AcrR family transcriptional regulator [Desertihabitans aurantiacus]
MTPRAAAMSPDERREAVVAAVTPLVLERGDEVTSRDIAAAAGVSEGTVFKAFASKDAVIDAVVESLLDPSGTLAELSRLDPQTLPEAVAELTAVLHRRTTEIVALVSVLQRRARQAPQHTPHQHELHRERSERLLAGLEAVLTPFADRLRVSPRTAASLIRVQAFATAHPMLADGALDDVGMVADLLLHGIARPDQRNAPC